MQAVGGCATGGAKITGAGELAARHVIHAVGPVWHGGRRARTRCSPPCYRTAIELAGFNDCPRVAFPSISTGVYKFPVDRAATIAIAAVADALTANPPVREARFWLFDEQTHDAFREALENRG